MCDNILAMCKILVTGGLGQLGREIHSIVKDSDRYVFTDITDNEFVTELDICNKDDIEIFCNKFGISAIVNCAAYTNVEGAEDPEGWELCKRINIDGVENLAQIAFQRNIPLITISTDYVFDGRNIDDEYTESSPANPLSKYGLSKLKSEEAVINSRCKGLIIRTSWLYSPYGKNFVKSMIALSKKQDEIKVVGDQVGNPTYAGDLAKCIIEIVKYSGNYQGEIFHYSNRGRASWADLASKTMEFTESDCKIVPITTQEYPTKAERPKFSPMSKCKLNTHFPQIEIPEWEESLKRMLINNPTLYR